jgi:UvrB/uvrC motif
MPLHARVCTLTSLLSVQHTAPLQALPTQVRSFGTLQCRHRPASHSRLVSHQHRRRARRHQCGASPDCAALSGMDANQLQTALQIAVDSEDFQTAGRIRDELRGRQDSNGSGGGGGGTSWRQLGVPDWLADRAEQYGLRFPTGQTLRRRRHKYQKLTTRDEAMPRC